MMWEYVDFYYQFWIEEYFVGRNFFGFESLSLLFIVSSSEMFKSDFVFNMDLGLVVYELEYDNYWLGMISDDDFFIFDFVSDFDLLDEFDIDYVIVSDYFSFDMLLLGL